MICGLPGSSSGDDTVTILPRSVSCSSNTTGAVDVAVTPSSSRESVEVAPIKSGTISEISVPISFMVSPIVSNTFSPLEPVDVDEGEDEDESTSLDDVAFEESSTNCSVVVVVVVALF